MLGTHSGSTGALTAVGEISDLNGVHSTLDTLRQDYNTHLHPDPQGGQTGTTTKPTP